MEAHLISSFESHSESSASQNSSPSSSMAEPSSTFSDSSIASTQTSYSESLTSSFSDSESSTTSKLSSMKKLVYKSPTCYYDPSTCHRQTFSIPEKIVYYIAKNVTNAETFQKLVRTCKYFYKVKPVIVIHELNCYRQSFGARYDVKLQYRIVFKYDQPIKFKIWVTQSITGGDSQVIPWIYKSDATTVILQSKPLKFDEFLFLAGNAENLLMWFQLFKYENGESVQFEDIVKSLPKLKDLNYQPCFIGSYDVNSNTVRKLMEIEHFKNVSKLEFFNVSEVLDVEGMYNFITENKHIEVDLWYRHGISDAYKQLVEQYSNQLQNEEGCKSTVRFTGMNFNNVDEFTTSSSEDDSSDTSFESFGDDNVSDVDENEDLMFPWKNKNEEDWELPWDKE